MVLQRTHLTLETNKQTKMSTQITAFQQNKQNNCK